MGDGPADDDPPLADLVDRVDKRRKRAELESVAAEFEEQSFEGTPDETVWDSVEDESPDFGAIGDVVDAGERTYVVSKRNFCERCPHFAEPPRATCTHSGTEIRAFVDKDHVEVYDCPVVEERGGGADPSID